jgi:hypothetical protein
MNVRVDAPRDFHWLNQLDRACWALYQSEL